MVKRRRAWPDIGDYVVGTISRVENHGAYAILDEYNNSEGMIHISEVAASWVRNIRNFVRERQKIVAKVLNVNPKKGHIDLSLKRVTSQAKKDKVKQWKRNEKAENLLELALKKHNETKNDNMTLDGVYNEVGWKMEDAFGDILTGFEETMQKGVDILLEKGINPDWAQTIAEISKSHVEVSHYKVSGTLEIQCYSSDGIIKIRDALQTGLTAVENDESEIDIALIGSPKYHVEVISNSQRNADAILEKATKKIIAQISTCNGQAKFTKNL
ncbi:MAG: translation initiation factor IF-2 subunit alpha [Candidatus Helarchaeota archaeon]|nr:translation initiation factor IF-2 subunit alpha [Candidatus Helarchaeota archaeon]